MNNKKFFYVAQIMNSGELIRYVLLLMLLHPQVCYSFDIITWNRTITDGEILISKGRTFAFGFFSLGNSSSRYLGIWYNKISEQTAVWVANRDNPINDTSGILSINNQGNLLLCNHQRKPIWSTKASVSSPSKSIAQLLDSGNLVVLESDHSQRVLWQSFDYPSNTMLPNLILGVNKITGLNMFLTSWKSRDNPGTGTITYKIDPRGSPQLFLNKGQVPLWRVGSWTGRRWSGVPAMTKNYIFTVTFINNQEEVSVMWGIKDPSIITRMVIDETGVVRRLTWHEQSHKWNDFWDGPKEKCDSYGLCGRNGNCDPTVNPDQFECTCLPGFKPKSSADWFLRDGSGGCVRNQGTSLCGNGEGFVKVARVKVPDTSKVLVDTSLDLAACKNKCLKNCSCMAYTIADEGRKMGCMTWHGDMVDTRTFPNTGQDLYVRVDAIELAKYSKAKDHLGRKALVAIVLAAAFAGLIVMVSLALVLKKRRGKGRSRKQFMNFLRNSASMANDGNRNEADLPFFSLSAIASITDNFSDANKLGEGGFGSVYKGQLKNGTEVALKRLSKSSGQGIEEFKNEIILIAKLQHRNLVRILGCCVEGEEKILIYEYLPNKSLDFILFDQTKKKLLGWEKRYEIICGVGRGLLYLHQDSRLRIIHRDLKASNVLLDDSWLPKISDFGMARIFGRDQMEAITNRVVGTYGYMSPEYAMEGLYSTKSDVYSFGILVLELVTGRKNSSFRDGSSANLVGHVWESWTEEQAMNTVDSSMLEEPFSAHDQVMRCIHIALLCVQENAADRPTMPTVISMLASNLPLPAPKQPAFIFKRCDYNEEEISTSEGAYSLNEMTASIVLPR